MPRAREFGDFQTPSDLARAIASHLRPYFACRPRVLEPTCGLGNFLAAVAESGLAAEEMIGVEIDGQYARQARQATEALADCPVEILTANIFALDLNTQLPWRSHKPLVVLGNPPWVTNAAIGADNGSNLPNQSNFKNLPGVAALTGSSNFDLSEAVWIKLLQQYHQEPAVIALLCKTATARNVMKYAHDAELAVGNARIHRIDARAWFDAAVDACLFTLETAIAGSDYSVRHYADLSASEPEVVTGFIDNRYVFDMASYTTLAFMDGGCHHRWRQGIKHDAASVLELSRSPNGRDWQNKLGELVDVEPDCVYPLLKTQDLITQKATTERAVIVTQTHTGDSTHQLEKSHPRLWHYLMRHQESFTRRKSRIYKAKEPFSMFGVGPYSFSPHKVVVSGFARKPRFWPVSSRDGKPILVDDTCYLLPCRSAEEAQELAMALNSERARSFLESITDFCAKRPVTAAVLNRINLDRLLRRS